MCRCLWRWAIGAVSKPPISSEIHFCLQKILCLHFPLGLTCLVWEAAFVERAFFSGSFECCCTSPNFCLCAVSLASLLFSLLT